MKRKGTNALQVSLNKRISINKKGCIKLFVKLRKYRLEKQCLPLPLNSTCLFIQSTPPSPSHVPDTGLGGGD